MKTKTINIYSFEELSKEAQERAHTDWIQNNDYFFLPDNMSEWLHELLEENNIKDLNDTSKAGTKPTPVYYSLSYCQGDGVMFAGEFEWKDYRVSIKHSGHYYHSYSKIIDIYKDDETGMSVDAEEEIYTEFENIYQNICKELERRGYDHIEYEDSLESFLEACEVNDYTFLENGKMENI